EILLAPDTADLLDAAATEVLSTWQAANLIAMQRSYKNAIAVPPELNHACTLAIIKSTQVWRELRAKNDWQGFLPIFKEVVNLSKQRGEARAAT
ncbi:carboxypeptidase M32, partial [Rhizobium sp. BUS002]|nr:carboxypeptidase M32 [Rhizobium phaseoli]